MPEGWSQTLPIRGLVRVMALAGCAIVQGHVWRKIIIDQNAAMPSIRHQYCSIPKMAGNKASDIEHHAFLKWALSHGIKINGLAPTRFPGRGMGMIATRTIEVSYNVHPEAFVQIIRVMTKYFAFHLGG
jgi:hypothetical protein